MDQSNLKLLASLLALKKRIDAARTRLRNLM